MLVLGIDPGLAITGYGLVKFDGARATIVEAGVLKAKRSGALPTRLTELFDGLEEILAEYAPDTMAMEELYSHYERPRTAILMGHARGVLCLAAARQGIEVTAYAATQIKKRLTGNGRAPKSQMQMAIQREFGLPAPPDPPDIADALAIALCHGFEQRVVSKSLTPADNKRPGRNS